MSQATEPIRTILITGGSRGIGLGVARARARRGDRLLIAARDSERLDVAAAELRADGAAEVLTFAANLKDAAAVDELVAAVIAATPDGLDALVLNAGVGSAAPLGELPAKLFDLTMSINLRAPYLLLSALLPQLRLAAAANPGRGAKVIGLSSITGIYAEEGLAAYGASKAALIAMLNVLNTEEARTGVSATTIAPGYVNTDMAAWKLDEMTQEQMITVADVAAAVDFALALSARSVISDPISISRAAGTLYHS